MSRCLYHSRISEFISADDNLIFGTLCDRYHGEALTTTREAWKSEISIMKDVLSTFAPKDGEIIFEYDIPRLGKRIDVVLLFEGIVFCLEFKVGESRVLENDIDQVLDYALDLKNFHKFSEDRIIVPILIATNYRNSSSGIQMSVYDDRVVNPLVTGKAGVATLIGEVLKQFPNESPVNPNWIISPYAPTPTIIEAAKSLYENHTVEDITRHEADKVSTDRTISKMLLQKFRCKVWSLTTLVCCGTPTCVVKTANGISIGLTGKRNGLSSLPTPKASKSCKNIC